MSFVHHHIDKFLEISSADAYCKDKNGAYLEVNNMFLRVSSMQSLDEVIGKTDLDLIWREQAPIMIKNDQEVMRTGGEKMAIELAQSPQGQILYYLSHKVPIRSRSGKIIGVFGLSFQMNNKSLMSTALHEIASHIDNPKESRRLNEKAFMLRACAEGLTKRQASCLYYLGRGMTMKQIAAMLTLSPKTVEHYLEAIKIKLNCSSRYELITKALEIGFWR